MHKFQLDLKNDIMATDIRLILLDEIITEAEMEEDCKKAIDMFKRFESKFSRFIEDSELSRFNQKSGEFQASTDLLTMIKLSQKYFARTKGYFDITILPYLLNEGYQKSKKNNYDDNLSNETKHDAARYYLNDLKISKYKVDKPEGLMIDLGGIGKGYIVDKVSKVLKRKYRNFLVDAGGDIYVSGKNIEMQYNYWAVDVENPVKNDESIVTLVLSDKAVATSGVNRRKWTKDGTQKNHLIDPNTGKSVDNSMLTVTVVLRTVLDADIMAKTILLMGLDDGMEYANNKKISAFIITKDLRTYCSDRMNKYVWTA